MIRARVRKNNLGIRKKQNKPIIAVALLLVVGMPVFLGSAGITHNYTYVKSNLITNLFSADNITNQPFVNTRSQTPIRSLSYPYRAGLAMSSDCEGWIWDKFKGKMAYFLTNSTSKSADVKSEISLRSFPYPYRAGLAISSDCDGCTRDRFIAVHKFLNTKENTSIGPGVGLEIADTFFPYSTIKGEMAYFLTNSTNKSADADLIEKYFHSGYIDSMHSFGDFEKGKFSRSLAIKILAELKKADIEPLVYINHGSRKNTQNIGHYFPRRSYCEGDDPHASQYHTDISVYQNDPQKGGPFRFLWKSDITDQVGYDPLQVTTLADGRKINAFVRYSTTNRGAIKWHLDNLQDQISDKNLAVLISSGKYMIIANHLCYIPQGFNNSSIFNDRDVTALRNLSKKYEAGLIYVAPTSKLLMYSLVHDNLKWNWKGNESIIDINIQNVSDPASGNFTPSEEQLQGITFYTPNPEITHVYVNGTEIKDLEKNPLDYKDSKSVTIPIRHLPPLPKIEPNSAL